MSDKIVCSLDEQQCQQECKHKSDRTKCPFVTVFPKKLYEGIAKICKQSTAPDKETPNWLETDVRRGAEFGYQLSMDELEAKDKEIHRLKELLEHLFHHCQTQAFDTEQTWLQFCKDNRLT